MGIHSYYRYAPGLWPISIHTLLYWLDLMLSLQQLLASGDRIYRLRVAGSKPSGGVVFKIENKDNRVLYRGVAYGNTIVPIEYPKTEKKA
jgi:hypothetical protein